MTNRREFLTGASATALIMAAPRLLEARPRGITTATTTVSGGFNGGKSQANFNFLQSGSAFPFNNALLGAQSWSAGNNSNTPVTPDVLGPNGLPIPGMTSTTTNTYGVALGGVQTVFNGPTPEQRPGSWVVHTSGSGTIAGTGLSSTPVTGLTRIVFTPPPGTSSYGFQITASSAVDPLTLCAIMHSGDEANWLAGKTFTQGTPFSLVDRLKQANFGVLRMMNWMGDNAGGANKTNITTWSTRKPGNYVYYAGDYRDPSKYAGLTSSVGPAYSATLSGFSLTDKASFMACFDRSAFSTVTGAASSGTNTVLTVNHGTFDTTFLNGGEDVYIENAAGGDWSKLNTAVFSGSVSGSVLTVASMARFGCSISLGQTLLGANGVRVTIASFGTGSGLTGTYNLSSSPGTVSQCSMSTAWTVSSSSSGSVTIPCNSSAFAGIYTANSGVCNHNICTMNVNGLGAVPILDVYAKNLYTVNSQYPRAGIYTSLATFVYDASLHAFIKHGGCDDQGSLGVTNGLPPEVFMELCTEVGAHPWFTAPQFAATSTSYTDWATGLANMCKATAPSWMIPRIEGPNETWNNAGTWDTAYVTTSQDTINGCQYLAGIWTAPTFSATAATYTNTTQATITGSITNQKLTVTTASANAIGIGDKITTGAVSGTTILGQLSGAPGGIGTYVVSTFQSLSSTSMTITRRRLTISGLTGNTFVPGSFVNLGGVFGGLNLMPSTAYVVTNNGGGQIVVNDGPTSGVYTSGGTVSPATGDYNNGYGGLMAVLGQAVASVYGIGNLGSTYQVLCGLQTSGANNPGGASSSNVRLASTSYALSAMAPAPFTNAGAYSVCSHICTANYMAPSSTGSTEAAAFAGCRFPATISGGVASVGTVSGNTLAVGDTIFGPGIPISLGVTITSLGSGSYGISNSSISVPVSQTFYSGRDMSQPGIYVDTLNTGSTSANLSSLCTQYTNWANWASSFGVMKMCGYEGGYAPDYSTSGAATTPLNLLRYASKFAPSLQGWLTQSYKDFTGTGNATYPAGFTGEFPSCFQLTGPYPSSSIWAVLEDVYQSPDPSQWEAIIAFNH